MRPFSVRKRWLNRAISRPASRLLAFLELLQTRRVVEGADAARELGVSARTIRRYAAALQEMGIPVSGQAGRGGGYRLRAGSRLPPLMLADEEAAAVAVGLLLAERRGLAGAAAATGKVVRVLPERLARRVERLRGELTLSGEPEPVPTAPETLLLVAEAVRRRRELRISYVAADGEASERTIEPLGLVARRARWYVPARDHRSGKLRTFRADRIHTAQIGAPAPPPEPGFDPDEHVVRMLAEVPAGWEVEVLVDAPLDELAPRLPATIAQLAAEPHGTRLRMHVQSLEWGAGQLAALQAPFRVVRPDELRDALARLASTLARSAAAPSRRTHVRR